jgi:hypothetical protein
MEHRKNQCHLMLKWTMPSFLIVSTAPICCETNYTILITEHSRVLHGSLSVHVIITEIILHLSRLRSFLKNFTYRSRFLIIPKLILNYNLGVSKLLIFSQNLLFAIPLPTSYKFNSMQVTETCRKIWSLFKFYSFPIELLIPDQFEFVAYIALSTHALMHVGKIHL